MLVLIDQRDQGVTAREPRLRERLQTRLHAYQLDNELAAGASPDSTPLLALRAQQLVRESVRNDLVRGLAHVLNVTVEGRRRSLLEVPVCRGDVVDAWDDIVAVIDRLLEPGPLPAAGIARVRLILRDGTGPLYAPSARYELRRRVRHARQALEPLTGW